MENLEKKEKIKKIVSYHNDKIVKYADESMEVIDYDKVVDDYLESIANEILAIIDETEE